jgi:hypothetical protein
MLTTAPLLLSTIEAKSGSERAGSAAWATAANVGAHSTASIDKRRKRRLKLIRCRTEEEERCAAGKGLFCFARAQEA